VLTLKKVAITGGLSSGKSTVCLIFKDLGAYSVSCDEIVHNLLLHDRTLKDEVIRLLGEDILTDDSLDRDKIARCVFSDVDKLKALERLIHPLVFHEINTHYQQAENDKRYSLFVAEVPLLYESDSSAQFDAVITVLSSHDACVERFMTQKKKSAEEFYDRMMRQMSPTEKATRATHILINDGSLDELQSQVKNLYQTLLSL
jgi:dephospho-CoA kinase